MADGRKKRGKRKPTRPGPAGRTQVVGDLYGCANCPALIPPGDLAVYPIDPPLTWEFPNWGDGLVVTASHTTACPTCAGLIATGQAGALARRAPLLPDVPGALGELTEWAAALIAACGPPVAVAEWTAATQPTGGDR